MAVLRLDNETSHQLHAFMKRERLNIKYCPPGKHRANNAERSIQTFKNHAIATLCTTAKDFPFTLWDKLLPQIELRLNYLHPCKSNPTISAYAGLHGGAHDLRAHPIAAAGCKVLIPNKPTNRGSWAPHAPQHYRCYTVFNAYYRYLITFNSLFLPATTYLLLLSWTFDALLLI